MGGIKGKNLKTPKSVKSQASISENSIPLCKFPILKGLHQLLVNELNSNLQIDIMDLNNLDLETVVKTKGFSHSPSR